VSDPDLRDPDLDRAYRDTPRDEPPAELDERVRAAAHRAVGTRPQSLEQRAAGERRRSWTSRWRVPLSIAATVVIAATVTVMVQDEEGRPRDDAGRDVAPLRVEPREAEQPGASAPAKPRSAPSPPTPAAPAPAAAPPRPSSKSAAEPGAPPSQPAPRPFHEERTTEAQQPPAADATPAVPGQLEMRRQAPPPAASPPPAAPAPMAAPKPAPQTAPAGAASEALQRDRTLGDRPERASREAAIRSPETWVEHIRSLRAQGREAEATTELAELRRAYPDFQLPGDLAR
jgi:hypothetical protein